MATAEPTIKAEDAKGGMFNHGKGKTKEFFLSQRVTVNEGGGNKE